MTESELKERLVIERILLDIEFRSLIFWDNPQARRVMPTYRYREPDVIREDERILEEEEIGVEEEIEVKDSRRSSGRKATDQETESALLDADMEQSA